jgi:hypothetical protein
VSENWWSLAACRGQDATPWFPARNSKSYVSAYAARFCEACCVRHPCLTYAIAHNEPGTWGGTSEVTRRRKAARLCVSCGGVLSPSERATIILEGALVGRCRRCRTAPGRIVDLTTRTRERAIQGRPVARSITGYDSDWLGWLDERRQ